MRDRIMAAIGNSFRCFGKGAHVRWASPVSEALKDKPLTFASGVEVGPVVDLVRAAVIGECAAIAATVTVTAKGHPQIDAPTPGDMREAIVKALWEAAEAAERDLWTSSVK